MIICNSNGRGCAAVESFIPRLPIVLGAREILILVWQVESIAIWRYDVVKSVPVLSRFDSQLTTFYLILKQCRGINSFQISFELLGYQILAQPHLPQLPVAILAVEATVGTKASVFLLAVHFLIVVLVELLTEQFHNDVGRVTLVTFVLQIKEETRR